MKVYVLMIESVCDYEHTVELEVWNTLGAAQESMWGAFICAEHEGSLDDLIKVCEDDTNICYQEDGDYTRNHWECTIFEQELLIDKEEE